MEARLDGSRVMEVVIPSSSWCDGISSWDGGSIMSSSKPIGDLTVRPDKAMLQCIAMIGNYDEFCERKLDLHLEALVRSIAWRPLFP